MNEDLQRARDLCTKLQQVIPFLVTNDSERLDLLQKKYIAVVAPACEQHDAFLMSEYLFFVDMLLNAHLSTRNVLGKAVSQAWIYSGRAHEQDQTIRDSKFPLPRANSGFCEYSCAYVISPIRLHLKTSNSVRYCIIFYR